MAPPPHSQTLGIIVKGLDSSVLEGATVTVSKGDDSLDSQITNSAGEAIFNIGNFSSWSVGDEISIFATKTGVGRKTQELVLTDRPQIVNIQLEQTSKFIIGENEETNTYPLTFAMLVDFQGNKITDVNPLPIKFVDSNGIRIKSVIQEENRSGSDASGSDGTTGRSLTLQNTSESGAPVSVWVDDQIIAQADFTITHKSSSSTIVFDNINLFDSQTIRVTYYV